MSDLMERIWVSKAASLTDKHGGFLPNEDWMRANGYAGLANYMEQNPKPFYKFPLQGVSNLDEKAAMVKLAETLAGMRKDGKLPWIAWLRENNFEKLANYIMANRSDFSHLKRAII